MKIILNESGHERNRNAGDEAYFASMVKLFRDYLGDIKIAAFSDRPERDRIRYNVDTVYSGGSLSKTLRSFFKILRAIMSCDVYIWGAGQILRDDTGIKSPIYRLSRPLLAKIFGKPVMAYALGIGPLNTRTARFIAKHILKKFDIITVRESSSKNLLEEIGVSKPEIILTVDPAFALPPASKETVDKFMGEIGLKNEKRLLIGIAPFGPAFRGKRSILTAKSQFKLDIWPPGGKDRYTKHIEMFAQVCDYMSEKYNSRLLFIVQDASWQGLDDRISIDIVENMKHQENVLTLKGDDYPPNLLKGLMGRMEFVIGGRMHSLILASGMHTPVLGICFEEKIRIFGDVINMAKYFIDAKRESDFTDYIKLIDDLMNNRQRIRADLKATMQEIRSDVITNVKRLSALLGSRTKQN
jgi:polysaccharide pyruvyl transferase CsaB